MADRHLDQRVTGDWSPGGLEALHNPVFPIAGQVKALLEEILERMTDEFNMPELLAKVEERTPYIVVAFQECERMNVLTREIRRSLTELDLGLKVRGGGSWWERSRPKDTARRPGERKRGCRDPRAGELSWSNPNAWDGIPPRNQGLAGLQGLQDQSSTTSEAIVKSERATPASQRARAARGASKREVLTGWCLLLT